MMITYDYRVFLSCIFYYLNNNEQKMTLDILKKFKYLLIYLGMYASSAH